MDRGCDGASSFPRALKTVALACASFGLAGSLYSALEQDWTPDEQHHLGWSRRLLKTRETERQSAPHYNSKTPVSVLNVGTRMVARRFLGITDHDALRLITRLPTVFLFGLLIVTTYSLGRKVLGGSPAAIASILVSLDPNLIANSSAATVDTAYALATLLTLLAGLRFAEQPCLGRATVLGLAIGFAFCSKFTAVLLLPGLALLPLGLAREQHLPLTQWVRPGRLALYAVVGVNAAVFIGASYGFRKIGVPLSAVPFRSPVFIGLREAAPGLPTPLPADFLTGIDILLASERNRAWNVRFLGEWYPAGVWYYFFVLWLFKTPVLSLTAHVLGIGRALASRSVFRNARLRFVALNLLLYVTYFSFFFRAQLGYRFVVWCVPLAAIVAASGLVFPSRRRWTVGAGVALVGLGLVENTLFLGNHFAFTNLAVLPKKEVFRWLGDSNVDWGQNDSKVEAWDGSEDYVRRT